MLEKILKWFIFSVVITSLPVVFNLFRMIYKTIFVESGDFSFFLLISKGEAFLISAAIAAYAIGELMTCGERFKIGKIVAGGGCVFVLLLSSFIFALISAVDVLASSTQVNLFNFISITIFCGTVVTSGFSIALAAISK